jgi:hypothetical protein
MVYNPLDGGVIEPWRFPRPIISEFKTPVDHMAAAWEAGRQSPRGEGKNGGNE